MAITNEEKQLAIILYEKYCDVFDAISHLSKINIF